MTIGLNDHGLAGVKRAGDGATAVERTAFHWLTVRGQRAAFLRHGGRWINRGPWFSVIASSGLTRDKVEAGRFRALHRERVLDVRDTHAFSGAQVQGFGRAKGSAAA